jgi:hypothetical protein
MRNRKLKLVYLNYRVICFVVLATLLCLFSISQTSATNPGPSSFNLAVSKIETSPIPYLELRSLNFQGLTNIRTPILWLWLSSSLDQPPRQEVSQPLTTVIDNETVVVAQSFYHSETYPAEKGAFSPHWVLVQHSDYAYGFGFLVAFNDTMTFDPTSVYASFYPPDIGDQWTHVETFQRFDSSPDNSTLSYWGLRPVDLATYQNLYHFAYKTFYLYEFTVSKNSYFVDQLNLTYRLPAVLLLVTLIFSLALLVLKKMTLGEALTLYLGTAFFTIPFLLSYLQLGLGPVSAIQEVLYFDIYLAIILALVALSLHSLGWATNNRIQSKKEDEGWAWVGALLVAVAVFLRVLSQTKPKKKDDVN